MTTPPPPAASWSPAAPKQRSRARRGWALTGSIALTFLCTLLAISAAGIHGTDTSTFPPPVKLLANVGAFVMIGVSVLLVWRHRWPTLVSALAIGGALVFPTTPLPALVAVAAVCAARAGWVRWLFIGGTYMATAVTFCWDIASNVSLLSDFVGEPAAGTPARLALYWSVPVLAAVAVLPFAGYGSARLLRMERDTAQQGTAEANQNVAVLHREVERERERQELARELHDTLAARLSVLSLHAGALELTVGEGDEKAEAAARAVRESAQLSLDDLRNVVRTLRSPATATGTGLADISTLIDAAIRDGADIRAQVLVNDPGTCNADVAHAGFRLVQESISNVRRHAPGAAVYLDVRGDPSTGLTVRVTNWLVPDATPTSVGGGHGLTGMQERVTLTGGVFQAGATAEGSFAVVAWMPWTRQ